MTPLPGLRELMRAGVRRSVAAEFPELAIFPVCDTVNAAHREGRARPGVRRPKPGP